MTTLKPGQRDPEGRRAAIIAAAAELIVEPGATLTHRSAATRAGVSLGSTTQYFTSLDELREQALQHLADQIETELAAAEQDLLPLETAPERYAALMHDFFLDSRQVRAEMALISAALYDPALRRLATRWSDRIAELLAGHIGSAQARAVVLYLDGAMMHAALHNEPTDQATMAAVIRGLTALPLTTTEGSDLQ